MYHPRKRCGDGVGDRQPLFGGLRLVRCAQPESGSVLLLALLFLVMVSLILVSLGSWATNDLNNTSRFQSASSELYGAGGATEVAIRAARYTYTYPSESGTICPGTTEPIPINGYYFEDWCVTVTNISLSVTRQVTLTACVVPSSSSSLTGPCQSPLLTVVVDFDDHTPNESPGRQNCTATSTLSCGAGMRLVSWVAN